MRNLQSWQPWTGLVTPLEDGALHFNSVSVLKLGLGSTFNLSSALKVDLWWLLRLLQVMFLVWLHCDCDLWCSVQMSEAYCDAGKKWIAQSREQLAQAEQLRWGSVEWWYKRLGDWSAVRAWQALCEHVVPKWELKTLNLSVSPHSNPHLRSHALSSDRENEIANTKGL